MKVTRILNSIAFAAAVLSANAANAEWYQFTVSGDYSATWALDSDNPSLALPELGLLYEARSGTYADSLFNLADVAFYSDGLGIVDSFTNVSLLRARGPKLYTSNDDGISFVLGTYTLSEIYRPASYTLTISAVPEPATYGMMLAGLGLVGVALRRRQAK